MDVPPGAIRQALDAFTEPQKDELYKAVRTIIRSMLGAIAEGVFTHAIEHGYCPSGETYFFKPERSAATVYIAMLTAEKDFQETKL